MKRTQMERPEENVVVFTFEATADELEAAVQAVYERCRGGIELEGYERGQADRAAIEAAKGESFFWYDAINDCMEAQMPALLEAALQENGLEPVDEPVYDLPHADKNGFTVTATVITEPEVTIGKYTGFTAVCAPNPVTEQDVEHFIQTRRQALAELAPHQGPAVKGDIAILSYVGFADGKAFEGGTGAKQKIQLGAGRMIPGFEEAILGHKAGDRFDIEVTFPANYGEPTLAGKPAVFKAHLEQVCVRQLPALNGDFARKAGGVDTMEEYRTVVRAKLEEMRLTNAQNRAQTEILRQLSENLTGSLPARLTDAAYMAQLDQFQQQLAMLRKSAEQYLAEVHQTREQLLAQLRAAAEKQVRVRIALLKIARMEKLEPTEAEVDAAVADAARKARKPVEQYLREVSRRSVRQALCARRAADFVMAHSTVTNG